MTAVATSADILDEIRSGPHWKVVIRPQSFEKERILTPTDCWAVLEESQVWLRGRQYPGIDDENREPGEDWVASWVESRGRSEYWRFFQSGLFVHYFGFREDMPSWRSEADRKYGSRSPEPSGYLDVDNALYTCTEIFEFTERLMRAVVIGQQPVTPMVRIGMHNIRNRTLSAASPWLLPDLRHTAAEHLEHSWQLDRFGLTDYPAQQAREATRWFLEYFGLSLPDMVLKPDQEKLFGRELYC